MPRKRKISDDEEQEDPEVENGVRSKRKAAMEARAKAKVVAHDDSDDEDDEDFDEEEEDDDFEAGDDDEDDDEPEVVTKKDAVGQDDDENDDEDEDVDADAIKVDCIEALLEEPSKDVPGYVLKKTDKPKQQQLEMWFSEEMSETIGDITDAFTTHYENKKLPVLQITKFDVIEEKDEIYQIDVLEAKFDKAYSIREKEPEKDDTCNLAHDFYCLVRIEGIDKTWATQYFMPEDD